MSNEAVAAARGLVVREVGVHRREEFDGATSGVCPALMGPIDVTVTKAGTLLVTDEPTATVFELTWEGEVVRRLRGFGAPTSVRPHHQRWAVADAGRGAIVIVDADAGDTVEQAEEIRSPLETASRPVHVAADRDGALLVTFTGSTPHIVTVRNGRVDSVTPLPPPIVRPRAAGRARSGDLLVCDEDLSAVFGVAQDSVTPRFGVVGESGSTLRHLNFPKDVEEVAGGSVLVADFFNARVLEVDRVGDVVWHYGEADAWGELPGFLSRPTSASRLLDGTTLITDHAARAVLQVDEGGTIVRRLGASRTLTASRLMVPRSVQLLHDTGTFLVADSHHNRVVEIDQESHVLRQFGDGRPGGGDGRVRWPRHATWDGGDRIYVCDGYNRRVLVLDRWLRLRDVWHDYDEGGTRRRMVDPHHLSVTPDGHLVLTDSAIPVVVVLDENRRVRWRSTGVELSDPHQARYDPYVDRIIVTDKGNHRIVSFPLTGGEPAVLDSVILQSGRHRPLLNPRSCLPLATGELAIGEALAVYRVDGSGNVTWSVGLDEDGEPDGTLCEVRDVSPGRDGLLAADSEHARIVELV